MRRGPLLVLGTALVLAGAWLLAREGGPFAGVGDAPAPQPDEAEDAAALAVAADDAARASAGLRARAGTPDAEGVDGEAAAGNASILGTVVRDGRPSPARVEARVWKGRRAAYGVWNPVASLREAVDAETWAPATVRTTRAGADGRFAIEALALGRYEVAAVAEDGAENALDVRVTADTRQEIRIVLPTLAGTVTLKGRVLRGDGTAWRGVVGLVPTGRFSFDDDGAPRWRRLLETDGEGRFAATGLRAGFVEAHAFDGERHVGAGPIRVPRDDEWTWNLDEGLGDASGRVVADADGSGIGGATVVGGGTGAWGDVGREGYARATTAPDGAFHLRVRLNDARVVADAPGYATGTAYVDEGVPTEVRLKRAARIEGRVTAEPGATPAAGAVVYLTTGDPSGRDATSSIATAGPDGRYAFEGLGPRDAALSVRGGDWLSKGAAKQGFAAARVTPTPGATTTVDLVVVRGARAEGLVVDAEGKPVAGARIRVEETAPADDQFLHAAMNSRRWDRWASGADGRFVVDDLLPGVPVRFRAAAPGAADVVSETMKSSLDAPLDVRLQFASARWLVVTVVDEAGKPVSRATVNASWAPVSPGAPGGNAGGPPSGADGVVRVGPIPGGALLELTIGLGSRDHRVTAPLPKVTMEATQTEATLTVSVTRGLAIEGRVTWPDGVKPFEVSISAQGPGGGASESAWPPDGAFRLRGLPAGTYALTAEGARADVTLTGKAEAEAGATGVVLPLTPVAASFLLRVAGPDGRPVPVAQSRLSLRSAKGNRDDQAQVSQGVARFDGDAWSQGAEEITVEVWEAHRPDGTPLPYGPVRATVPAGRKELAVTMPAEAAIAGRVVDPEGRGVGGVWVYAQRVVERAEEGLAFGASTRTNADGAFRVGGLGEGRHTLSASPGNAWLATSPAPAAAGDTDVRLVVRPALEVRLIVVDDAGKPLRGSYVAVQGPQASANGQTDDAGVVVLSRLSPGDLATLQVNPPNERRDLSPLRRERWMPRDDYVRLERALGVAGWVRDTSGKPVPGATVQVGNGTGQSGDDGAFVVDRVAAGELPIRVRFPADEGNAWRYEGVVTAGRRDVVVVIDAGCVLEVAVDGLPAGVGLATALLLPRGEGRARRAIGGWIRGASVRFGGLEPDQPYAFYACNGNQQEFAAYAEPLRCGDAVRLRAVPAPPISVSVRVPAGAACHGVSVDLGGWWAAGRNVEGGKVWEIRGVPDGPWTVRAWGGTEDGRSLGGVGTVRRGVAEIELAEAR